MKKDKIILSISILVSGREETKKCLESVKTIMDNVPSELILVDTGCDEHTKKIIDEYADIIIPFAWCDDFSRARNEGLNKASGEWFMYIDDDEWFDDTSEIVDFFIKGEYKEYKSALYIQRNYLDDAGETYTDAYVSRMVKIEKETQFKSKIHEYINTSSTPMKILNSYVHHYGYIFESETAQYKHVKRNVDLLHSMLEEEPKVLRWDLHIMQEYMSVREYEKVIEHAFLAIKKYKLLNENDWHDKGDLGCIYGYLVCAFVQKYEFEKARKYIEIGLDETDVTDIARAFLHRMKLIVEYSSNNYEQGVIALEEYLKLYDRLANNKEETIFDEGYLISDIFSKSRYQNTLYFGILVAIMSEKHDVLDGCFKRVLWEDSIVVSRDMNVGTIVKELCKSRYNDIYKDYVRKILICKQCMDSVIKVLQIIEYNYTFLNSTSERNKKFESAEFEYKNMLKIFADVDNKHWYFTYLKILNADVEKNSENVLSFFKKLFEQVTDIFNFDEKLWQIASRNNVDIGNIIIKIDYDKWKKGICNWIDNSSIDNIRKMCNYVDNWNKNDNIRFEYFYMKVKEGLLVKLNKNKTSFEEIENEIIEYSQSVISYYKKIYKEDVFYYKEDILPMQCRFALDMLNIIEIRKQDSRTALEELKNIIDKYNYFVDVINMYSKLLGEKLISENKLANKAKMEMQELSVILKIKAREYIESGNVEQARVILQNIIQNVPNDKEAHEILSMISE